MAQRIALLIASLAAAGVLALALAAAGFAPVSKPTAGPVVADAVAPIPSDAIPSPSPSERVQIDTVYVKAAPPPKVVHVIKKVKARPAPIAAPAGPSSVSTAVSNDGGDGQESSD